MDFSRDSSKLALICLVALAAYISYFYPFLSDDALISLRYSQRLMQGHGLTWTDGRAVEGYTNLLWVLLNALLGWMGVDLVVASRVLGLLFTALTAAALLAMDIPGARQSADMGRICGLLAFCLSATTAVWAIGGLEQPIIGACIAWSLVWMIRLAESESPSASLAVLPGIAFALMCITRPDSPLLVMSACAALILAKRKIQQPIPWSALIVVAGIPLIAYLAQSLFRHSYYGEWFANTARVKLNPSIRTALHGLYYVCSGMVCMAPLAIAGAWGAIWLRRDGQTARLLVLLCPAVVWFAYVIIIGGDIFPAFRHFTPLVVIAALAVSSSAGGLLKDIGASRAPRVIMVFALAFVLCQTIYPAVQRARSERWEWNGRDLALMLRAGFGARQPLLAVTAAGCLPYWTGYPSIDMLGLNDYYIPRHPPPPEIRSGGLGHDLGSGAYVLSRHPDLIIYNVGDLHDSFLTGKQLETMPEFLDQYTPVSFRVTSAPESDSVVWINRYSELVGQKHTPNSLVIPGYLVNGNNESRVYLNDSVKLVVGVTRQVPAMITIRARDRPMGSGHIRVIGIGLPEIEAEAQANGDLLVIISTTDPAGLQLEALEIS